MEAVDRTEFAADPPSIATSPIVFAMPESAARGVGWPTSPLQLAQLEQELKQGTSGLTIGLVDPHRDTAGLVATMLLGEPLAAANTDLPALVGAFRTLVTTRSMAELLPLVGRTAQAAPAAEQAVVAFDSQHPALPLAAVQLEPAAPNLDYPYAIRSDIDEDHRQAASRFGTILLGPAAQDRLAQAAFRDPEGNAGRGFPASPATTTAPAGAFAVADPERVRSALNLWSAVNEPPTALLLADVSASMQTPSSGGLSRAGVMSSAARHGFDLLAPQSRIGMWTFGAGHHDVVPVGLLTGAHRADLEQRIAAAAPGPSDRSDLYAAVGDAYMTMLAGYDPGRPNFIIVLTDGGDSAAGGARLAEFSARIEKLSDPTKPVRIIVIGINVTEPAAVDLEAVTDVVGGGFFPLTDPAQVDTAFLKALLEVGEA